MAGMPSEVTREQITAALNLLGFPGDDPFMSLGPALVSVEISHDGVVINTSRITPTEYSETKTIVRVPRNERH